MFKLRGCGTALITPFKSGDVDFDTLKVLLVRQLGMADFLVLLGTTAESPCLSDIEKEQILLMAKEYCKHIPIVIGCGSNSLPKTIDNMNRYDKYNPYAYLVVVPFYNKPTQHGMYEYYKQVAAATKRNIIIYNVPSRTGSNIDAETVIKLSEIDNIIGIKEASGDLNQVKKIIDGTSDDFCMFSGNDEQVLDVLKLGGDGVISVASNLECSRIHNMLKAYFGKDEKLAKKIFKSLKPFYEYCFLESNPIPIKAAMNLRGLCSDEMRLPLTPATSKTREMLKKYLEDEK